MCNLNGVSGQQSGIVSSSDQPGNEVSASVQIGIDANAAPISPVEIRHSPTTVGNAMSPAGPPLADPVSAATENVIPIPVPHDGPAPPEHRGPGGCCSCWTRTAHMITAGLVQAVSTALTFGTKPLIEAAVQTALGTVSVPPIYAQVTASVVGGIYVGLIHTTVSSLVSGIMNSAVGMHTYQPKDNEFLGEFLTIDLPVGGAFVGGYALRSVVMDWNTNIWLDALSKTVTSTAAGFVQGAVTDALRQTMAAYEAVYSEKPARNISGERLQFFKDTLAKTLDIKTMSGKDLGHNILGKTVGSTLGMLLTQIWKHVELPPFASGALGMTTYLASWFTGIHLLSAVLGELAPSESERRLESVVIGENGPPQPHSSVADSVEIAVSERPRE